MSRYSQQREHRIMARWVFMAIQLVAVPLLILLPGDVSGMPSMLIEPGVSKCFTIEAARDTIIRVDYESPDIIIDQQDPDYVPTYLSINVRPFNRVMDTRLHMAPVREHLKPTNEILTAQKGKITHKFEVDGEGEVCFRPTIDLAVHGEHRHRRHNHPHAYRISFRIRSSAEEEGITEIGKPVEVANVEDHLSFLEQEMERIAKGMQSILAEADYAKERESHVHKQTLSMHNAALFWPIVQVFVLIMTGFTQASHIVHFFKTRRII